MKVIEAYSMGLEIPLQWLQHSVETLQNYGNMSSATILFVLKKFLENTKDQTNEYGLMASLGPGFGSELVLLKWD